jgi:hypothetical protein
MIVMKDIRELSLREGVGNYNLQVSAREDSLRRKLKKRSSRNNSEHKPKTKLEMD